MKRPLSLRTRLISLMLLAIAIVWMVTAFMTWREARKELAELLAHPPATTTAHLDKEREEITNEIAEHLVKPILVALPALAVLLVIVISIALRPLNQLTREVAERAPDRLDPLPADDMPAEVVPLVHKLNALFADIVHVRDKERSFTADAAHELRTPLAALKAQAQVAQASLQEPERQHALNKIIEGCDRATHLVTQLLTLARLDAQLVGQMQTVALRPLAEEVLAASAGMAIEHHCDLELGVADAQIRGDPTLLRVLLRNLVDNAILHSGGTHIVVAIVTQDDQVILSVQDNGRGIPLEEREHVQQRFYRVRQMDQATGSGLGLSIVHGIAELHSAQLTISDGSAGQGTEVKINFSSVIRP